jgi:hypothetical protein
VEKASAGDRQGRPGGPDPTTPSSTTGSATETEATQREVNRLVVSSVGTWGGWLLASLSPLPTLGYRDPEMGSGRRGLEKSWGCRHYRVLFVDSEKIYTNVKTKWPYTIHCTPTLFPSSI